jgi:hypothetical protein
MGSFARKTTDAEIDAANGSLMTVRARWRTITSRVLAE